MNINGFSSSQLCIVVVLAVLSIDMHGYKWVSSVVFIALLCFVLVHSQSLNSIFTGFPLYIFLKNYLFVFYACFPICASVNHMVHSAWRLEDTGSPGTGAPGGN